MKKNVSLLALAAITLLAMGCFTASLAQSGHLFPPPPVPDGLDPPPGNKLFFASHADGTQNYVCRPPGTGFAFVLFTPQATLFDGDFTELTTHFFSPNPSEANTDPATVGDRVIRATWQDSRDSSRVWAAVADPKKNISTDFHFVAKGAVAWLLLTAVGGQPGPTGGDRLSNTTFVQRLNTSGGAPPSTGCAAPGDVGNQAFVHYTADYFFYKKAD
jgi:hypothetical protein